MIFFFAGKQVDCARVDGDIEVLQPPSTSNMAGVVPAKAMKNTC